MAFWRRRCNVSKRMITDIVCDAMSRSSPRGCKLIRLLRPVCHARFDNNFARSGGDAAFRWFVEGATHYNWGNMARQKNRQINTGLIASF
jgi:hypothetical protein